MVADTCPASALSIFGAKFISAGNSSPSISVDEWNTAVAKAQELLEQSEQGKLTDEELAQKLKGLSGVMMCHRFSTMLIMSSHLNTENMPPSRWSSQPIIIAWVSLWAIEAISATVK